MPRRWVVILVVVLLAGCTTRPTTSPVSETGAPKSSSSSSSTPGPAASPVAWTKVFTADLAQLTNIVAAPPGLIALGYTTNASGNFQSALMLTSPDGVAWTQVGLAGAADTVLERVLVAGKRLFATGNRFGIQPPSTAAVWTSVDGQSWTPVDSPSFRSVTLDHVATSPFGVLAMGTHVPDPGTHLGGVTIAWDVAADGSFVRPRDVRPPGWPGLAWGVIWTGDRYLAWAPDGSSSGAQATVLMTSATGKIWTVLPQVPAFVGHAVIQIAFAGGQFVALGNSGETWLSTDGLSWQLGQIPATWSGQLDATAPGPDVPTIGGFVAERQATLGGRVCTVGGESGSTRADIYCR